MAMIGHRLAEGLALMAQDEARGAALAEIEAGNHDRDWRTDSPYRGYGRTSSQMRRAAKGAVYLWPVQQSIGYARHLAHHLGRDDLEIMHMRALDGFSQRLRGLRLTGVVVDHACWDPRWMDRHRERALASLQPLIRG